MSMLQNSNRNEDAGGSSSSRFVGLMGPTNEPILVEHLLTADKMTIDVQKILFLLWKIRFSGAPFCDLMEVFM
jgi:hypothetical protein